MYQQVVIVGNLGRDPEMRYTPSGDPVANMSVATNKTYHNSAGEKVQDVTWWRVSVWGKQAEACHKYLAKGRQVLVIGELQSDANGNPKIFTRQDGSAGASFELRAFRVQFLGSQDDSNSVPLPSETQAPKPAEAPEEIPF